MTSDTKEAASVDEAMALAESWLMYARMNPPSDSRGKFLRDELESYLRDAFACKGKAVPTAPAAAPAMPCRLGCQPGACDYPGFSPQLACEANITASRLAGQGEQPTPAEILVQACRPEDRAMLQTDAGAELVRCAASAMTSTQCPDCRGYGRESDGSGARSPYGPKCQKCGGTGRVSASPAQGEQPAPAADLRNALHAAVSALGSVLAEPDRNLEQRPERRAQVRAAYDAGRAAISAPAPAGDAPKADKTLVNLAIIAAHDLAGWAKSHNDAASKNTAERLLAAALAAVPGDAPKGEAS